MAHLLFDVSQDEKHAAPILGPEELVQLHIEVIVYQILALENILALGERCKVFSFPSNNNIRLGHRPGSV